MRIRIAITVIMIVALSTGLIPGFQFDGETENRQELRVMNLNSHFGVELNEGYELSGFMELIERINPHILGLEEITVNSATNGFTNMYGEFILQLGMLGYEYSYITQGERSHLRNAIFSKIPFENVQTVYYTEQNAYFRSFIHAEFSFGNLDYDILVTHMTHQPATGSTDPSNDTRRSQITELVDYAQNIDSGRIIAIGDFNFTPDTEFYNIATGFFTDSWLVTNPNDPGYTVPSQENENEENRRIDYIFVTSNISPTNCVVIETTISDHKPIYCDMASN